MQEQGSPAGCGCSACWGLWMQQETQTSASELLGCGGEILTPFSALYIQRNLEDAPFFGGGLMEAQGVTLQLGEAARMGFTALVCCSAYLGEQQREGLDSAAHELLGISAECAISHAAT